MKVVSLLPAATEMMYALGLGDQLVAVSHDCDFPAGVSNKPQITHCEIHGAGLSSAETDAWVRRTLLERGTLYTIDETLLRELEPDVILTQQLCDVCAPAYGSVAQLAATLRRPPQVLNLEPSSLADIFANIRTLAGVLGVPDRGDEVVRGLQRRVDYVRERTGGSESRDGVVLESSGRPAPIRCLLLEWLEPLYCSGHWGPELVDLAGGFDPLGQRGKDSIRIDWEAVIASNPEALILACCGNSVEQTLAELPSLNERPSWNELPAVRNGRVYVLDGSAYFSRPGPRTVDSLELLAGILHPQLFPEFRPEVQPPERVTQL